MADKKWYETLEVNDCLEDNVTWNDMTDYIRHSACIDFTIHSECTSTGQAFLFTEDGTESKMFGGDDAGNELVIYANSVDPYPYMMLNGGQSVYFNLANTHVVHFAHEGADFFNFTEAANESEMYGCDIAGGDLKLRANGTTAMPYIFLQDAGGTTQRIYLYTGAGGSVQFYEDAYRYLLLSYNANKTSIYGGETNGDDLIIKANFPETYPYITLYGNNWIGFNCAGNIGDDKCGVRLYDQATKFMDMYLDTDAIFKSNNQNIYLNPGTGKVKFGTYSAKGAEAFDGYIEILDAAGNARKIMTCA